MTEIEQGRRALMLAGRTPGRVAAPSSDADVAAVLADANAAGQAVVPVGGATMLAIGDRPARYDVALSTERLAGIVEYEPADLTVVVKAGTAFRALDDTLREHGQCLPLHPPFPDRATVGGILAANVSGPWRGAYGSARDMVIGMRMALPDGRIAKSGGRVVKNVAGYDLAKVFIGSFGSLGVIVEAAFRVYPRPRVTRTMILRSADVGDLWRRVREFPAAGAETLSVQVVSSATVAEMDGDRPCALVTLGGRPRAVEELASGAVRVGAEPLADADAPLRCLQDLPARATVKIAVRPSRLPDVLPRSGAQYLAYPRTGLAYVTFPDVRAEDIRALRSAAAEAGGSAVLLNAPDGVRAAVGTWGSAGPDLEMMRTVKRAFDQKGTMCPGRFLGDL